MKLAIIVSLICVLFAGCGTQGKKDVTTSEKEVIKEVDSLKTD